MNFERSGKKHGIFSVGSVRAFSQVPRCGEKIAAGVSRALHYPSEVAFPPHDSFVAPCHFASKTVPMLKLDHFTALCALSFAVGATCNFLSISLESFSVNCLSHSHSSPHPILFKALLKPVPRLWSACLLLSWIQLTHRNVVFTS